MQVLIIFFKLINLPLGNAKEQAIARLVTTHVPKAEKARRHGRELSFILPHNAVDHFASLFTGIEQEINNKNSKLGKTFLYLIIYIKQYFQRQVTVVFCFFNKAFYISN